MAHGGAVISSFSSPVRALTLAMLLAAFVQAVSLWFMHMQPWLGISLRLSDTGETVVASVDSRGPSALILVPGDVVASIGGARGERMSLKPEDLIEDPDEFPRFADFRRFMARQGILHAMLGSPVVHFVMSDGRVVRVQPAAHRPLSSLPWSYWANSLFAWLTLLMSVGVWCLRQDSLATRLLLLSGVGLFVGASTAAPYLGREIALDATVFHAFSLANSVGNRVFAIAGLALLWCYPERLGSWRKFGLVVASECLFMANQSVQWVDVPPHSFYADYLVLAPAAVAVGVAGWRRSAGNPVNRAILKLLFFPIYMSVFLAMAVFVLPVVLYERPLIGTSGSYMLLLIMYGGLALGVARHRLFDVERWWIQAWLWFAMGMAFFVLDGVVISLLHLDGAPGLLVSMLVVAWFYFPLRQWAWQRIFRRRELALEAYVPKLVSHFARLREHGDEAGFWRDFLAEVFQPLSIAHLDAAVAKVGIADDGVRMQVPMINEKDGGVELRLPGRGGRLFDQHDAWLAQGLLDLARKTLAYQRAYALGMEEERQRIMRDLHDDVGERLLTLAESSGAKKARRLAGEALDCLREVIYFSFDEGGVLRLSDVLESWQGRMQERLEMAGAIMEWSWDVASEHVEMPSRDVLSLGRMLYEGVSNALGHARPRRVAVKGKLRGSLLQVEIVNDGLEEHGGKEIGIAGGKGIHNIRQRAAEMNGQAVAGREGRHFVVRISVPVRVPGEHGGGETVHGR